MPVRCENDLLVLCMDASHINVCRLPHMKPFETTKFIKNFGAGPSANIACIVIRMLILIEFPHLVWVCGVHAVPVALQGSGRCHPYIIIPNNRWLLGKSSLNPVVTCPFAVKTTC